MVLPSFCLESLSSLAKMARWTSSIAPVLRCQHVLTPTKAILTTMTGQRSRAEMKANDDRSEVAYGATMAMDVLRFRAFKISMKCFLGGIARKGLIGPSANPKISHNAVPKIPNLTVLSQDECTEHRIYVIAYS